MNGQPDRNPQPGPGFGRGIATAFAVYGLFGALLVAGTVVGVVHAAPNENYPGAVAAWDFSVLFLVASLVMLIVGITLAITRRQSGFGPGLLLGWVLGLIVVPLVTFGACVGLLNVVNSGG